jgi:putative tricarboxylic transport membrane protein
VGAYAERNNFADVGMILVFGIIGYLFDRFGFPIAPMVLGTILGPLAESSFLRSMIRYDNDWTTFFRRPISCSLLLLAIAAFVLPVVSRLRRRRQGGALPDQNVTSAAPRNDGHTRRPLAPLSQKFGDSSAVPRRRRDVRA